MSMQNCEISLGWVPANFGTATTFLKWTRSQTQTGFLSYMGSRLNLGCALLYTASISVLQCTHLVSLALFISHSLSTVFSFPLYDLIINRYQHDRDLLYKEPLSLFQTCFSMTRIDSNGRHGDTVGSILEHFWKHLRLSSEAMLYTKNLRGQLSIGVGTHDYLRLVKNLAHMFLQRFIVSPQ